MFDIEQAKQTLQQRIDEMDAQIAVHTREIEQGMHVERELNLLQQQRDDAARRLAEHGEQDGAEAKG